MFDLMADMERHPNSCRCANPEAPPTQAKIRRHRHRDCRDDALVSPATPLRWRRLCVALNQPHYPAGPWNGG